MTGRDLALHASQVRKSFGGVHALRGVDLEIGRGEIHALLGENGAGKSTIIKVLAGVLTADDGDIAVRDTQLPAGFTPADVAAAGIRFVHQDLGLIDTLTVAENIAFQTGFRTRFGLINGRASRKHASDLLDVLGASIDPSQMVGALSQADKTIVGLARALEGDARLVVLDEVTASLPTPDVTRIHDVVRAAQTRGAAFLYVTHRLEEVFSLCESLTVLADGRNVATSKVADTNIAQVVKWMTGRSVSSHRHERAMPPVFPGERRLTATGLGGAEIDIPLDLSLHAGEIVGITGIRGSGYDRICRWLAGIEPVIKGQVDVEGQSLSGDPRQARALGGDIVMGDRSLAAFPALTVRENLFPMGAASGLTEEKRRTRRLLDQFGVRPAGADERAMMTLSGGNQQKVIFARSISRHPKVIVLIDPTAGVDIGARHDLHEVARNAARDGAAIVFGSSDFEEIAEIADRAIVMRKGGTAVELTGEALEWNRLMHLAQDSSAGATVFQENPA